ncbi:hypothetical protein J6590_054107 [Homalodisca vitripennis]|nr:hypothetical protein J6590_054107 [Homalodisca vitripennis]
MVGALALASPTVTAIYDTQVLEAFHPPGSIIRCILHKYSTLFGPSKRQLTILDHDLSLAEQSFRS